MFYQLLDIFFLVFHSSVILFNVFGWIWKKTRPYNLTLLLLTAASWFILGIWYGWGYCICTDWHWDILRKMGKSGMPSSYIKYLLQRIFDMDISADLVNLATVVIFFIVLVISVILNIRDYKRYKNKKAS